MKNRRANQKPSYHCEERSDAAIRLLRCGITAQIKNQTNPSDKSFHNEF